MRTPIEKQRARILAESGPHGRGLQRARLHETLSRIATALDSIESLETLRRVPVRRGAAIADRWHRTRARGATGRSGGGDDDGCGVHDRAFRFQGSPGATRRTVNTLYVVVKRL